MNDLSCVAVTVTNTQFGKQHVILLVQVVNVQLRNVDLPTHLCARLIRNTCMQ